MKGGKWRKRKEVWGGVACPGQGWYKARIWRRRRSHSSAKTVTCMEVEERQPPRHRQFKTATQQMKIMSQFSMTRPDAQITLHCGALAAYSGEQRESWGKDHKEVESRRKEVESRRKECHHGVAE